MNMYEAVNAAAVHIGAHPENYSFATTTIPPDGRSGTGCMLGRIAQIVGFKTSHANEVASALLGVDSEIFFDRVGKIVRSLLNRPAHRIFDEAAEVAPALLIYAEKYRAELEAREYPPGKIPKSVREIFNPQVFSGLFIGAGVAGSMAAPPKACPPGYKYSIVIDDYVPA
jgi:hypothetical protein